MSKENGRPASETTAVNCVADSTSLELGKDDVLDIAGTQVTPSPADPDDPFDVARLRATPLADVGVKKVLLTVPVRRPGRTEFFRVHPGDDYWLDCHVLEHSEEMSSDTYWVSSKVQADVVEHLRAVRFFTCVNKQGTPFLWPAKLPGSSSSGRRWSDSALQIAEVAKGNWVKMVGNKDLGAYELFLATGNLGEPTFPEKTLQELLRLAFTGDRLIDSMDHPVLRALRGDL